MDRRPSHDEHAAHRLRQNANVFDDDFAEDLSDEDDFVGVSDGFRPANATTTTTTTTTTTATPTQPRQSLYRDEPTDSRPARRSISSAKAADSQQQQQPLPRRSSIAKGPLPAPANPFSDSVPNVPSRPSQQLMHRASVASTSSYATTSNQSQAPAGPSHPYGMYPQNTGLGRSPSVVTASTLRRQQSTARPQHPYGMYPQNPFGDDGEDDDDEPMSAMQAHAAIPVGFPGLNTGYHRQIGPDGEEQDIIGPDGHTEQLPPYSRYPEEGPTKASLAANSAANSPVSTPIEPTRRSMNESRDALVPPPSRDGPVVALARMESITPSAQESQATEKAWADMNWSERKRTRVLCGRVPLWLVIVLIGLLLIFGIILGAAIGSMLSKEKNSKGKNKQPHNDPQAALNGTPTLFDASSIPTPSSFVPVATGSWEIPLDQPEETQRNCLTDNSQSGAWSCSLQGPPVKLRIQVDEFSKFTASIQPQNDDDDIGYGLKAPKISKQPMDFVKDLDNPSGGPALHFLTQYNKVVIVPNNNFATPSSKMRRSHNDTTSDGGNHHKNGTDSSGNKNKDKNKNSKNPPPIQAFGHRFQVQPGDFPWVCQWNGTFIETFIYVDQNSSFATQVFPSSQPASTTPPSSLFPEPTSSPLSISSPVIPTSAISTITAEAVTNAKRDIPAPSPLPFVRHQVVPAYAHAHAVAGIRALDLHARGNGNGGGGGGGGGNNNNNNNNNYPPPLPFYPRVVKVEERRVQVPNLPPAVCQQMQIASDKSMQPRLDANNQPIFLNLTEVDPNLSEFYQDRTTHKSNKMHRREDPSSDCHCQWILQ